jgi:hypothetical protein
MQPHSPRLAEAARGLSRTGAIAQQRRVTLIPEFQNLLKEYMPAPRNNPQQ